MTTLPPLPRTGGSGTTGLLRCAAVFLPADPARDGRVAFWRPGRPERSDDAPPPSDPGAPGPPGVEELTVAVPEGAGIAARTVRAVVLPVDRAVPVLTRARAAYAADPESAHPAAAFWGAAALLALHLVARGRLLPGLSDADHDVWRAGPLDPGDLSRLRDLAGAMPAAARAVPLPGPDGGTEPAGTELRLPAAEPLVRAFLDAVTDGLPRSPAAALAAGGPAFAAREPQHLPEHRDWAAEVAAGHDAGVRVSLRIELTDPAEGASPTRPADGGQARAGAPADDARRAGTGGGGPRPGGEPRFRAVVQLHSPTDPALVSDAAEVWAGDAPSAPTALGPQARMDTLLVLRRAARVWAPLGPLLSTPVPDAVELADEEVTDLLGEAGRALDAAGVRVHWPREAEGGLTVRAAVGPAGDAEGPGGSRRAGGGPPALLSADAVLAFGWRFAVGGRPLTGEELDRLAEASRPVVRLRDQWVLLDPETARRARDRRDRELTPLDALGAVLTGSVEEDGRRVQVEATGWLATLRERLADPEGAAGEPVEPPAALAATLRDYQRRGLAWLHRMTSLGLGCCLADDMGLGKTVTLIALHLHRQTLPGAAGPTLVVCPASLLGTWQREIGRFAPGTPVRRWHAGARDLGGLADGEFVLTTYGTMRRDARLLAEAGPWGMVVADEAQHVKNPYSATAKQLRTIGAGARVALTGTPVENSLSELWAILDWTTPGLLGTLGAFRRRYARAVEAGTDPAAAERLSRLVRPFLLRRRKSDPGIVPELPPRTETDRVVALTEEQAGLYEAVVREALAEISGTGGFTRRGLVVKLLTALKQICNHPAQYLKEDRPRIPGRSGKLELLDELLDTVLAEGRSVLVFTQYVQMARIIRHHLADRSVPAQLLHGGTPVAERERMVLRFQEGGFPVFLLSLKAAGTGLTLTRAEHVVHYDRWWNPAVEAQATDRAHRIGQTRPVQVHRIVTEGTVEDRIAAMLRRKQELAQAVLGSGEAALAALTDAELAGLVELREGGR